jgi:hypothetical protein
MTKPLHRPKGFFGLLKDYLKAESGNKTLPLSALR